MNAIALQRTVADMIDEYDEKAAGLSANIAAFNQAIDDLGMATSVGGAYGGDFWWRGRPAIDERAAAKSLLVSGWKAIYSRLNIDRLAPAKDRALWERTIADPPPLTVDNAIATFGDYLLRARWHVLRGLAEVFADLDPAYRSHSKVKIGVRGLPKRVILTSVGSYGSYGRDRLRDVLNALAAYRGQPLVEHAEFRKLDGLHTIWGHKTGAVAFDGTYVPPDPDKPSPTAAPDRGVVVRKFQNGNAHVIFTPETLLDINRALAEFYGEVLPDAEGEEPGKRPSTAVARDLQFYPTPASVIEKILDEVGLYKGQSPKRVLEPSCGDGRILDVLRDYGHRAIGIEYHAERAAQARAKGHAVLTANFLEQPPTADFDVVVMNPPFYGRHYLHHVRHALRFLRPGGRLVTVLPATAWYDHGELKGRWTDLPVASFSESGTNIPTGFLIMAA